MAGALVATAIAAVAVAAVWQGLHYSGQPAHAYSPRPRVGLAPITDSGSSGSAAWEVWLVAALVIGGIVGARYARDWWRTVAVDVTGLAIAVGLGFSPVSPGFMVLYVGWFSWVMGVALGSGERRLQKRRRIRAASFGHHS